MVDIGSGFWGLHFDQQATKDLIVSIVQRLHIGTKDNLVALHFFDRNLETQFELLQYIDKTSLISHIDSSLSAHTTASKNTDTNILPALHTLMSHVKSRNSGDRQTYPDAIVIIGNKRTTNNLRFSTTDRHDLQQISRDVIVLDVGGTSAFLHKYFHPRDELLATDSHHIIQTTDLHTKSLVDKLYQLIIEC